jgi:hypothetical protein
MSASHRFLKLLRLIHLYLGVFTAPMLLFFAITGGLQTFSLHERTRGSDYAPPAWLATMAQLHKKQTTTMPQRKPPGADAAGAAHRPNADGDGHDHADAAAGPAPATDRPANKPAPQAKNPLPMKIFFAFVALGLLLSTLTGLYMSYKYTRHPWRITLILLAGIVVPLLLMLF